MKNVIYLFLIILFSPISVKGQEMLSPDSTICFIDSKEADYQFSWHIHIIFVATETREETK